MRYTTGCRILAIAPSVIDDPTTRFPQTSSPANVTTVKSCMSTKYRYYRINICMCCSGYESDLPLILRTGPVRLSNIPKWK